MVIRESGMKRLSLGIVEQAVVDYRKVMQEKKSMEAELLRLELTRHKYKYAECKIAELKHDLPVVERELAKIENFFRSEWCYSLCGDVVNGERIIKELRKQVYG